jgi:predicted dinucleotide-binding enzyme
MNLGIIGAGKTGGALGSLRTQAGRKIKFGTPNPADLQALVAKLAPNASAATRPTRFGSQADLC